MLLPYLTKIFKYIFTQNDSKPKLGRWKIENCYKIINKKIDLSNEDHCGPCGNTKLNNIDKNQ